MGGAPSVLLFPPLPFRSPSGPLFQLLPCRSPSDPLFQLLRYHLYRAAALRALRRSVTVSYRLKLLPAPQGRILPKALLFPFLFPQFPFLSLRPALLPSHPAPSSQVLPGRPQKQPLTSPSLP